MRTIRTGAAAFRDEHRPIGEGAENWPRLVSVWREHAPRAVAVLESDRLEVNLRSLEALRGLLERSGDA